MARSSPSRSGSRGCDAAALAAQRSAKVCQCPSVIQAGGRGREHVHGLLELQAPGVPAFEVAEHAQRNSDAARLPDAAGVR
jgi:hypothetical protein